MKLPWQYCNFIPYVTVNTPIEKSMSLWLSYFMNKNVGAGPGLTKPGCSNHKKSTGAGPRVNMTLLNDKDCLQYVNIKTLYCIIIYVCCLRFFSVQITAFYAYYWLLYSKVSLLLSNCSDFHSKFLVRVCTRGCCPIRPSQGRVVLNAQSVLRKSIESGGSKWVSLRRCAQNDLVMRYLFHQAQSFAIISVRLPVPQGT